MLQPPIEILKSLWSRQPNGRWGVTDLKGISLHPRPGSEPDYFIFESSIELLTSTPSANLHEMFASFGPTDFLMKQSVVPVVAWKDGDAFIRCIGTASVVSCSGYLLGESAYALGYAEMNDVPLDYSHGIAGFKKPEMDLYASIGEVMQTFPQKHFQRDVSTPGPCFDFQAKIPGKMSGAPIFGAQGAVIRGIVSRSFSKERHAFGAMLGPAMHLPLDEPSQRRRTLRTLMESGNEGMARIQGAGL